MKIALCALVFVCLAGAAFGQSGIGSSGLSAEPVVYEFNSHQARATQTEMGQPQEIMEHSTSVWSHGTRPLWEMATPAYLTPLGDSARSLRKEHLNAKKAEIVWNN
jgi:hypothetical protein